MYALYGISEDTFSGAYEAWENSVHPEDIEFAREKLNDAVIGKGVYDPEFRVVHPNGEVRTMKASAEILRDGDGEAKKVIGVNYDMTEKIEAINQLTIAKQEAEEANQSKREFLANMSHEIRTPMNAILGGLQLLNSMEMDDKLKVIVDNASFSAKSLLTIINDILDYSKIEENKLDLEHEAFSLLEVIESVKFDVDAIASNKGLNFITNIDEHYSDGWVGDIVRVKQVLLNLVSNAVKFTEDGYVRLDVSTIERKGNNAICIKIIDSGVGMTEEAQSRLFDRFIQADSSTTRKFGGTGLGMSITVSLIHMMGGSIDLQSTLNEGTTIKVILPLESTDISLTNESTRAVTAPSLVGKKILVAEDNDINQILLESMLNATNADVIFVKNGKLAVEASERHTFDLILMDIQMPVMDGLEAQKKIEAKNADIPIVALTANVMTNDVKRYKEQGFAAHIGKPIDLNKLYGALRQLFLK